MFSPTNKWASEENTAEIATSAGYGNDRQHSTTDFDDTDAEEDYQFTDQSNDVGGRSGRSRFRKMCLGGICVIVVVCAVVGVSLGVTSTRGSSNKASKPTNVGGYVDMGGMPTVQIPGAPTMSPGPTPSDAYIINDIIDSMARFGGAEFENPMSYQARAKQWVLTQDFPVEDGSSLSSEQQALQLYAVACIYFSTFGVRSDWTDFQFGPDVALPGWYSSRGWLGTAADVCSWYGLTCDEQGRVSKIQLDTNGLTGFVPPELAYLAESLNTLDLYNNMLHNKGDAGNSFLGELTNLEYLFFGSTYFEYDGVPSHIGQLTKLKEMDISYTLYFGELDGAAFENLSNLKYLVMDGNAYNSSLPTQIVNLPQLEYLYVGFSFLEGDLSFLPQMPTIFELWIDDNPGLTGTIPTTIGQASTLVSLSATNCDLSGPLPTELGQLTDMIQIWLFDNAFTGTIPTELGNLIKMKILDLQKNQLVGTMPDNICERRQPFGRLEELEADCDGAITCEEDCCTCCGAACINVGQRQRLL